MNLVKLQNIKINIQKTVVLPYTNTLYKEEIKKTVSFMIASKNIPGTSLVAQWLGIRLPMQGTWVRVLVREDPTCRGTTKPVRHNY